MNYHLLCVILAVIGFLAAIYVDFLVFSLYKKMKIRSWLFAFIAMILATGAIGIWTWVIYTDTWLTWLDYFMGLLASLSVPFMAYCTVSFYRSLRASVTRPSAPSAVLLRRNIRMVMAQVDFINRLIKRIVPFLGFKIVEEKTQRFKPILKGLKMTDEGGLDIQSTLSSLEQMNEKKMPKIFSALSEVTLELFILCAAIVSRKKTIDIFKETSTDMDEKYKSLALPLYLPLLLFSGILEPLLMKCKKKSVAEIQREFTKSGKVDIVISSEGEIDFYPFYQKLTRIPATRKTEWIISEFSAALSIVYPFIERELGEKDKKLLSESFVELLEKYPDLVRYGLLDGIPETIKLPEFYYLLRSEGAYVIEEFGRPIHLLKSLENLLKFGFSCIYITAVYPPNLQRGHAIKNAKFIWVSRQEELGSIKPSDLDLIRDAVSEFLNENKRGAVFLDCLEYLLMANDFSQTWIFLKDLRELIAVNQGRLIFSVDPRTLDKQKLALLEREATVIRHP